MSVDTQRGARLLEERKRLGLSQQRVADELEVRREMWSKYESGAEPGASVLSRCALLGIDTIYVLTGVRMDEATRSHLTRAIQFSVQLGDPDLTDQSIKAAECQANEIRAAERRRQDLMAKLEKLSEADVGLLMQMADRIAQPKK